MKNARKSNDKIGVDVGSASLDPTYQFLFVGWVKRSGPIYNLTNISFAPFTVNSYRKPLIRQSQKLDKIIKECNELISIFVSGIRTAQKPK